MVRQDYCMASYDVKKSKGNTYCSIKSHFTVFGVNLVEFKKKIEKFTKKIKFVRLLH